jgi:hypothetical protein
VDNGINVTMILYGQTAVGEYAAQTAEWRYYLGDAQLSVRQLVDESGVVTQAQTYGPYGVLLHQAGDGGGLFGYQGGQWFGRLTTGAAANGLWYFGDGYFDPNTGQFLATNGNPLLPLVAAAMVNPAGLLLGPVLLINWRRRKGKKGVHPATFLLLGVLLTAGLASCGGGGGDPTGTPGAPTLPPTGTSTPLPTVTVTKVATATATATVVTITATPTITCAPETPTPPPPTPIPSWLQPLPSLPPSGLRDGPPTNPGGQQAYNAFVILQEEGGGWWGDEIDAQEAMVMLLNHEFGPLRNIGGSNRLPSATLEAATHKYNEFCSAGPWTASCLNGFWAYSEPITNAEKSTTQRNNIRFNERYGYAGFLEELKNMAVEVMNNPGIGGHLTNSPSDWFTANNLTPVSRQRYWDSIKVHGLGSEALKEVYWCWPQPSSDIPDEQEFPPQELFLVFTRGQYPGTIRE